MQHFRMHPGNLIINGRLCLADGTTWDIAAGDSHGESIGALLADVMQLKPVSQIAGKLLVLKNGILSKEAFSGFISEKNLQTLARDNRITHRLFPAENQEFLAVQLMKLALIFCWQAEAMGGLLVHGALAERGGRGVILTGPGEVGKTTASRRLPLPWKSLCDDCTLIVRNGNGSYLAHPWPTWSQFMFGNEGGSWDVQHNVPLEAIFFLKQNPADAVEPVGRGQAACMLSETVGQAWQVLANDLDSGKRQAMNLQRFNNICEINKNIPAYLLHISRDGAFWEKMEKAIPLH